MQRLNPNAAWLWPLLGIFIVLMMSSEDPFRVALLGFLLSVHRPVWRALHGLEAAAVRSTRLSP